MTDAYIIEKNFLLSAEARKLATLAGEQAAVYATPATLKTLKKGAAAEEPKPEPSTHDAADGEEQPSESDTKGKTDRRQPPVRACSMRCLPPDAGVSASSATRGLAR